MASLQSLESLFGGKTAARVLLYIENYGEGYSRGISSTFELSASQVQKQLRKLEDAGILVGTNAGKTRMYRWNDRDPSLKHLRLLLKETLEYGISKQDTAQYFRQRSRPRKSGKE